MKRLWLLVALGVGAYLVFAVSTVPANLVITRLAPLGVQAAGVSGTIWNGRAEVLVVRNARIGTVSWRLRKLPLLLGRLSADVKARNNDSFANGHITLRSGRVDLEDLSATVPLSALPPEILQGRGWTATVNLKIDEATLVAGFPTHIDGTVEALEITGPPQRPVNMGSYKVTFPMPDSRVGQGAIEGALVDLGGGPVSLTGSIILRSADRYYDIGGAIAARPDAPRDIVQAIELMPEPDAQGRRPLVTGNL